MKFGRTINKYNYKSPPWPKDGNIGDCIQSLAVENLYKKAGIEANELLHINRDDVKTYQGEEVALIMQGWFANYANVSHFPLSKKILPIFIGFHLNPVNHTREDFIWKNFILDIKKFEPIGCRDRNTRDFLLRCGIDAYFSGCLTLTFDKRTNTVNDGKIFIVDVDKKSLSCIPKHILDNCDNSITHFYYFNEYPVSQDEAEKFELKAKEILNRYKEEASLVITSKIHVAMPCIAMGIPVVFITDFPMNERFDVIRGIIPIYHYSEIEHINWNPQPVEITELKEAIISNAIEQIQNAKSFYTSAKTNSARKKLEEVTKKLNIHINIIKRFSLKTTKRNLRIYFLYYIRKLLNFIS